MDVDLRKLRYFVAAARLEHVGRAAEELFITQPVLSRQLRALERDLGVELFTRAARGVRLTAAGRQLLEDAVELLSAAESAVRRTRESARGVTRLVVGFGSGLSVSQAVRAYSAARPAVEVALVHLTWWEQAQAVRDGLVDVALVRLPAGSEHLRLRAVGTEEKVVCLPAGHPLAAKPVLASDDLLGHEVLDARARRTSTVEEKLELVASGVGLAVLPVSVAAYYARADVVTRPAPHLGPVTTSLATSDRRLAAHVQDFVDTALTTLTPAPGPSPEGLLGA
ncbi:LysR family transcriptional regulator [Streptomyces sp. NP160]|uniref:LysR family transcriptional regulator n=1 Tax=Streptomyces sp. NP160 TaxID=2586637 RepID=UPI00111ADA03|nr:LysR family transcriptional regulator [Streptomyces sp. NP160]TNM67355.1 LysR family transcriptional regulator [Streptomyces sp. NP160]